MSYVYLPQDPVLRAKYCKRPVPIGKWINAALFVACSGGYLWQGVVYGVWGASLAGLAAAAFFAIHLSGAVAGGSYLAFKFGQSFYIHRKTQPFTFWLVTSIMFLGFVISVTMMFVDGPVQSGWNRWVHRR